MSYEHEHSSEQPYFCRGGIYKDENGDYAIWINSALLPKENQPSQKDEDNSTAEKDATDDM